MTISKLSQIGTTDISSYVLSGAVVPKNGDRKIGSDRIPSSHRAVLYDEGTDPLEYEYSLRYIPGEEDYYDTHAALFRGLVDGTAFYPGRADRFGIAKFGDFVAGRSTPSGSSVILHARGTVWSEAAELYDDSEEEWDVNEIFFPYTQDTGFTNSGSIEAGLYALEIDAGVGLDSLVMQFLSGATVISTINLVEKLMEDEELDIDRFGQITQTYADTFAADKFSEDGFCYAKYVGAEIVLTSVESGIGGEDVSITITDTDQAALTVVVVADDITVDLATVATVPVSTAQEVIDAINADASAAALVSAALADGEDGSTVIAVLGHTHLALNVAVGAGVLTIQDDREAEYHLTGYWPIIESGLLVTFTPTATGAGVASLDVSVDSGATWETVIDSDDSDWTDTEEMEVYVPQAKGETEVWIRFACDSDITSVAIDNLEIYQQRAVSESLVPTIPVGSTYKLKLSADEDSDSYDILTTEAGDTIVDEAAADTIWWPNNTNLSILATWRNRYVP